MCCNDCLVCVCSDLANLLRINDLCHSKKNATLIIGKKSAYPYVFVQVESVNGVARKMANLIQSQVQRLYLLLRILVSLTQMERLATSMINWMFVKKILLRFVSVAI